MNWKMSRANKKVFATSAIASVLAAASINAHSISCSGCQAACAQVSEVASSFLLLKNWTDVTFKQVVESSVIKRLTVFENNVVQAIDAQTRVEVRNMADVHLKTEAQLANSSTALIQARGAIALQQQQQDTIERLRILRDKLAQPITTCLSLLTGTGIPRSEQTVRTAAAQATASNLRTMRTVAEPLRSHAQNYEYVQNAFCSKTMKDKGTCTQLADPLIQDGDIRAGLLFGDEMGGMTRRPKQEKAVKAVTERLAGVRNVPPPLPNPSAENNSAGKSYVETQRDYEAVSQLASSCINRTVMATRAQQSFGKLLRSAGLEDVPDDVSHTEAMHIYAKAQVSPTKIQDMAGATEPEVLLRSIAQNRSFNLLIQQAKLDSLECDEAILATTLSMQAKDHFGEKAKTLYENARLVSGR